MPIVPRHPARPSCPARASGHGLGLPQLAALLLLPPALALAGCGGLPHNATLTSPHQPEISHTSLSLDLAADANGLAPAQKQQLATWFAAKDLRYGDRITVADPLAGKATIAAVADVAADFGIVETGAAPPPATGQALPPAMIRVILTRARAHVPHCPDWSGNAASNPLNATSTNFGCATSSNLAAMIANPDDLLHGATASGHTGSMSAEKAIAAWRLSPPTTPGTAKDSSTRQ